MSPGGMTVAPIDDVTPIGRYCAAESRAELTTTASRSWAARASRTVACRVSVAETTIQDVIRS
jgi:hypothetical protein